MATFGKDDDLRGAELFRADLTGARFVRVDLSGARFVRSDLSGVVMRGVDVAGAEIESPWLLEGGTSLLVNGVDVAPLVDAELDRRFPGRAQRSASDPAGLRAAWAALEAAWDAAVARVEAMPPGTTDVSVDGEWSFAQTVRHLVMAIDTWLRRAVLEVERPYHPIGQPDSSYEPDGDDPAVFSDEVPAFADVLAVWSERARMVRDFVAGVTPEELATPRSNPWAPQYPETTLSCLRTILEEGWEHLRYALRDLDTIDRRAAEGGRGEEFTADDAVG